jgi:hypothetical protein
MLCAKFGGLGASAASRNREKSSNDSKLVVDSTMSGVQPSLKRDTFAEYRRMCSRGGHSVARPRSDGENACILSTEALGIVKYCANDRFTFSVKRDALRIKYMSSGQSRGLPAAAHSVPSVTPTRTCQSGDGAHKPFHAQQRTLKVGVVRRVQKVLEHALGRHRVVRVLQATGHSGRRNTGDRSNRGAAALTNEFNCAISTVVNDTVSKWNRRTHGMRRALHNRNTTASDAHHGIACQAAWHICGLLFELLYRIQLKLIDERQTAGAQTAQAAGQHHATPRVLSSAETMVRS